MASGRFATAHFGVDEVDSYLHVYTVPDNKTQTLNIRLCNRNKQEAHVTVAIGVGENPAEQDFIDYLTPIDPYQYIEDTGIVVSPGEKIWVTSDIANVSVRVHGLEE